jgi:hypothetical protein
MELILVITFILLNVKKDLENINVDFNYPPLSSSELIQWIVDISSATRSVIGPNRIISHAPQR